MSGRSRLVCAGCGAEPARGDPYPFRCPRARPGDDVDHVLRRELDLTGLEFPADAEPNPFVRYRSLFHVAGLGLRDADLVALVRDLDRRVAEVDGHGFVDTPFARADRLSERLGFAPEGGIWVKDETGNVSGSHKARHLFGVALYLEAAERVGLADPAVRPELAVASCGNAALAAAVVAAAAERVLRVFVPSDADPTVLARLEALGARVVECPRKNVAGDPTVVRLLEALDAGALPFTCQGNLNGLAVEGGLTLPYELAASGVELDRLVVQVGGGALASACGQGLREAVALGALPAVPRLDTVQTRAAWPLKRAFDAIAALGVTDALAYAARHRSEFMWPWESEPHSVAHGILDDETYDWLAVVEAMLAGGGAPVAVDEATLVRAHGIARETTGIRVDPTGSAGLAGLIALRDAGLVGDDERVGVLFTGVARAMPAHTREDDDEELSRQGHPVAQGV